MATDYDAPRGEETERPDESLEELTAQRADAQSLLVDVDETELLERFELVGADFIDEELAVTAIPIQSDEFRCSGCFLARHHLQLAARGGGELICRECA